MKYKKVFIFSCIVLSIFILNNGKAFAISGACSYHGGVNCSMASYGKVVCNDGWINSSVNFIDVDECKISNGCPVPITYGYSCRYESDYATVEQQVANMRGSQGAINARRGLLGSSFDTSATIGQDKLDACRNDINSYNLAVSNYNQCLKTTSDFENKMVQEQVAASATSIRKQLNAACENARERGLAYSGIFDTNTNDCQCALGYIWNNPTKLCTEDPRIDAIFSKNFYLALDAMPQYNGVADYDTVKALTLNPANSQKTFAQIIMERYSNIVQSTSTLATPALVVSSTASFTTGTAPVNVISIKKNLSVGASSNDVVNLQKFLENKGFLTMPLGMTKGYFGLLTKQALTSFQKSTGLPATGYCGAMTRASINAVNN